MKTTPARWLTGAAAAVIVTLTGAAFWLSYAHLHTVAAEHGLGGSEARAWAWPATLDLFVVAGELLMLRASLARSTDWWAIGLTVAGSGGSIALNIAGVTGTDPLDYVTAAVPPTAALLAFGALMRQVHGTLTASEQAFSRDREEVQAADLPFSAVAEEVGPQLSRSQEGSEAAGSLSRTQDGAGVAQLAPVVAGEDLAALVDGPVYPEPVPGGYTVVPEPVELRFMPLPAWAPPAFEGEGRTRPVLAAEQPRTRAEVHVEYVPGDEQDPGTEEGDAELIARGRAEFADRLADDRVPPIREIRSVLGVGQARAQRVQDALRRDVEQGVRS